VKGLKGIERVIFRIIYLNFYRVLVYFKVLINQPLRAPVALRQVLENGNAIVPSPPPSPLALPSLSPVLA
jgi:hypothetical protein